MWPCDKGVFLQAKDQNKPQQSMNILRIAYKLVRISGDFPRQLKAEVKVYSLISKKFRSGTIEYQCKISGITQ